MKNILTLVLKEKWFTMIQSGIKLEEYREIKPYWNKVFLESGKIKLKGKVYHHSDIILCLCLGYKKDREKLYFTIKRVRVGEGKKEWGAEPGKEYHTILLGDLINKKTIFAPQ